MNEIEQIKRWTAQVLLKEQNGKWKGKTRENEREKEKEREINRNKTDKIFSCEIFMKFLAFLQLNIQIH